MYVEVSGRQSGKTQRLCGAIDQWLQLSDRKVAYVICRFQRDFDRIRARCVEQNRVNRAQRMCIEENLYPTVKFFVDEFDYVDDHLLNIHSNGYYCTTARKFRTEDEDDFFTRLIEVAESRNDLHQHTSTPINYYLEMSLGENKYDLQILNKWRRIIMIHNRNGANEVVSVSEGANEVVSVSEGANSVSEGANKVASLQGANE